MPCWHVYDPRQYVINFARATIDKKFEARYINQWTNNFRKGETKRERGGVGGRLAKLDK